MRVAFVSLGDPRDVHNWSGIPSAVLKHMVRAGADVEIIAPLSRSARYLFMPRWVFSRWARKAYHVDREPLLVASFAREIERRMRGSKFDAIFSIGTIPIARLKRPEPVTYWTDAVWDSMTDYYYNNPAKGFESKARRHEQQAMDKAAHAVYSSEWAANSVRQHYDIEQDKLAVLPFGPNMEITHDRGDIEVAVAARPRDVCTLLFIGVDWQRKGGAIAVETARKLNLLGLKTRLLVVGCKVPDEKPDFVEELGFISKSTPAGRERLAELLRSSHFLIFPTRAECSAIVLSEACAFGLPIITTETGGVSSYVRQDVNGVRLPLSAGAEVYTEQIYRLFHDRVAYEGMALGAWEEYRQRLNWESSVGTLLELLPQG